MEEGEVSGPDVDLGHGSEHSKRDGESNASIERSDSGKGRSIDDEIALNELSNNDSSTNIRASTSEQTSLKKLNKQKSFECPDDPREHWPLNPASIENDNSINQFEHSTNILGSPLMSDQSNEDSIENEDNIINNTVTLTQPVNISKGNSVLYADSKINISSNFQQGLTIESLPAPAISPLMPGLHLSRNSSLSLPPQGLVSREIMDQLRKELLREKSKVFSLRLANEQLIRQVTELEERHVQTSHGYAQLQKMYSSMQCHLKQKCEDKERDINRVKQELKTLQYECDRLTSENQSLHLKIKEVENEHKKSDETLKNVRSVLKEERQRFGRDINKLEKKVSHLESENQFLREKPEIYNGYSQSEVKVESTNSHTRFQENESNSGHLMSAETQPKGVYSENAAVCNDVVYQRQGARPKQGSKRSTTPATYQPKKDKAKQVLEEMCENCYREAKEFDSSEEFLRHLEICSS